MNIFTANQVNQVYVLKPNSTVVSIDDSTDVTTANNLGTIGVGETYDGKSMYFKHLGAGGVVRSDLIDLDKIERIVATPAAAMAKSLLAARITLNSAALNNGAPIVGQDYILRIAFDGYVGISPEDSTYLKYGIVHAVTGMSTSNFYLQMASSIAKNMSREAAQLIKVFVTYSTSSETEITATSDVNDTTTFNQTYTGILIKEVEPDWILGTKQQKRMAFAAEPASVYSKNELSPIVWGDVVYSDSKKLTGGYNPSYSVVASGQPDAAGTIINSKLMADYEYFWHGERGDQYRMVGFPDYIPTTYLVDPAWQYGYDVVSIHYSYIGSNESCQKSEKDISIVIPRASTDSTASSVGELAGSLVTAINAIIEPNTEDEGEGD